MKPESKLKLTPKQQKKIKNCDKEPTCFACGLVECQTLGGVAVQECIPKRKGDN